jgi:hypothetical protein
LSNFNTVSDLILRQNAGQPIVTSFATPGHYQVQLGAGAAVLNLPNPLAAIDTTGVFQGRAATAIPFIVRAAGLITAPGSSAFQIDLNLGTALAPTLFSTGITRLQPVLTSTNDNWLLEIYGLWDPTSTFVRGIGYGWVGSLAVAQSALINNTAANLAALQFNIGITGLNANPSNQLTLTEFSADFD